jgi:hypothetical protein
LPNWVCLDPDVRPPNLGDAVAAARVLRAVQRADRPALLRRLMAEARQADRHRQRTGFSHPDHGDGSLMAAALRHRVAREPGLDDEDYCRCLAEGAPGGRVGFDPHGHFLVARCAYLVLNER